MFILYTGLNARPTDAGEPEQSGRARFSKHLSSKRRLWAARNFGGNCSVFDATSSQASTPAVPDWATYTAV